MEGRPHAVDAMLSDQINLVFNTAQGAAAIRDSYSASPYGADKQNSVLHHRIRQ